MMNMPKVALAFLVASAFSAASVRADIARKNWRDSYSLAPGGKLWISNDVGNIVVEPSSSSKVEVFAEQIVEDGDARAILEKLSIRAVSTHDRVEISVSKPKREWSLLSFFRSEPSITVNYRVRVPDHLHLDLYTANGDISLQGVTGLARLRTTNGDVAAIRIRGEVSAETINGDIDVDMVEVASDAALSYETVNGKMVTHFPKNFTAQVDASSVNGRVRCEFAALVEGSSRSGSLYGRIGEHPVRTVRYRSINGSVLIRPN